ncbi:MAG: hypothetical protein ACLFPW_13305 [Spirochaetaceae bacterium]
MAAQTDITPIFAIPPRSPELHWDLIHRLRAELRPLEGSCAPVWIHPADPNLSTPLEALPETARRVWEAGAPEERFALSGYAGAPLSALTEEEMRRELQWAERNPWGGGARLYNFDGRGAVRAPNLLDPKRPPPAEGVSFLLATFEKGPGGARLLYAEGDALYSLPLLRLRRESVEGRSFGRELARFLRRCRKEELPGLLLMEVDSTPGAVTLLREAVTAVAESRFLGRRITLASFPLGAGVPESSELLTSALLSNPIAGTPFAPPLHRGLRQAAAQRSLPGSNRERQRMILTAFREEQAAEERNPAYGRERIYTAAMHGSAEILGDAFSVRTEEGRPSQIVTPTATLGFGEAAVTTVRFPGSLTEAPRDICSVESVTAFSFDAPLSRGIREESSFRGQLSGRSRLDSYFLADFEELFLALELSLSGSIDEELLLTPVEYVLTRLQGEEGRSVTVERTIPHERALRETILLESTTAIPIFASELTLENGKSFPGLRCGSADLWKGTVMPMALSVLPVPGSRSGRKLAFAPFGMVRLPRGEIREIRLRRTVRIAPLEGVGRFAPLSRDLRDELLLWEGNEA